MEKKNINKKTTNVIGLPSVKGTSSKVPVSEKDHQCSKGTPGNFRHSKVTIDECTNFSEIAPTSKNPLLLKENKIISIEYISKEVLKQFISERQESPDKLDKDNVCFTEAACARTAKNQLTTPETGVSIIGSSEEMHISPKPTEKTSSRNVKTPISVNLKAHSGIMFKFNPVKKTVPTPFTFSSNSKRLTRTTTEPALNHDRTPKKIERNPGTAEEAAATETPHRRTLTRQNSSIEKNPFIPYEKTKSESNLAGSNVVPSKHSGITLKSKLVKKTISKPFGFSSNSSRLTKTQTDPALGDARTPKESKLNTETSEETVARETPHPQAAIRRQNSTSEENSFFSKKMPKSEANPADSEKVTIKKNSSFGGLVFKPKRPLTHSRRSIFNNVQRS